MFQSFYDFPLANANNTFTEISLDFKDSYKFLLISDCHIGDQIDIWFNELKQIIEKEKPTNIIVLGDLIDGHVPNGESLMLQVFSLLKTLPFQIYVIGGNHDRIYIENINWSNGTNIHLIDSWSILIQVPQSEVSHPLRIFLAHELGNNYRVRDRTAFQFFKWLKNGAKDIRSPDWLICGHAHTSLLSREAKVVCIGQYSPQRNKRAYSLLTIENGIPSITGKVLLK